MTSHNFKDLYENMSEMLQDVFTGAEDTLTYSFDQAINTYVMELVAVKKEEYFKRDERFRKLLMGLRASDYDWAWNRIVTSHGRGS